MEVVLIRDGKFWYHNGRQIKYNRTQQLPGGWSYVLRRLNNKLQVEAYKDGERQYQYPITSDRLMMFLLADGTIELARLNDAHFRLARLVNRALINRAVSGQDNIVARVEVRNVISGMTFRAAPGTNNNFSDGDPFETVRHEINRITMACVGGTYLVRAVRHATGAIFAVNVFVQPGYNKDRLFTELYTLA